MKHKQTDKRRWVIVLTVALIFIFPVCSHAAPPIKLGVAGVYSGELAPYGISGLRGVKLAVEYVNTRGGILGRALEPVVEDDLCKPKQAANIAAKMVVKGVDAVIGHTCSGATLTALETYKEARIVVVSPSATHPALTRSGRYPNFFRTIAPDDLQARVQVDFTLNVLKLTDVAVLHDKGVYGRGLAEYVKTLIEKSDNGAVVLYEGIPPAAIDFSLLAQKIHRSQADAVIFGGYHPAAAKLLARMRKMKMEAAFVSGDGIKDDSFVELAGKYAEGAYATAPQDTAQNPLASAATRVYRRKYGESPGAFFLSAYAATLALANAIAVAGTTGQVAISKALKSEYVETPLGKITFDQYGDIVGVGFTVYRVRDGRFVEVK